MSVPKITLNNGVTVPQAGLGVFQIPEEITQPTVEKAFELGYRHIDTAAGYYNEEGVGAAIRATGLPREDVFVTTKCRNGDQGYENALAAFEASRRALGLDVVDLYLIHWPVPSKDRYMETWRAFEKLLDEGAVRAVGVSNFLPEHLDRLVRESDVVPAVNQVEHHPTFRQPATVAATERHGIVVEGYSPIGRGRSEDLEAGAVTAAAEAHGVTAAQVALRWAVQRGVVVIPKSVHPERMASNLDIFSFELTPDEMAAVDALHADSNRIGTDPAVAAFTQFRS